MTREERRRIVGELLEMLQACERFNIRDVMNRYAVSNETDERDVNLALHESREIMRLDHGVDFAPIRGMAGMFHRASPVQIESRARRGRSAGWRKLKRALERTMLAATLADDPKDRERLEAEAGRHALKLALARKRNPIG